MNNCFWLTASRGFIGSYVKKTWLNLDIMSRAYQIMVLIKTENGDLTTVRKSKVRGFLNSNSNSIIDETFQNQFLIALDLDNFLKKSKYNE